MRFIRMGRKQGVSVLPNKEGVGAAVTNTKRNLVTVDVLCKKYTMLFASDFNPPQEIVSDTRKPRTTKENNRSTKSQFKSVVESATLVLNEAKKSKEKFMIIAEPHGEENASAVSKDLKNKPTRNTDVLGTLNVVRNSKSSKPSSEKKREKRKRIIAEDVDISAENIPLEAVLPKLEFGKLRKDICPKKRRRLQSLLSPKSPSPSQFFPEQQGPTSPSVFISSFAYLH